MLEYRLIKFENKILWRIFRQMKNEKEGQETSQRESLFFDTLHNKYKSR